MTDGRTVERPRVFISYAEEDEQDARMIDEVLTGAGHDVWRFPGATPPGDDWHETMLREIAERDVVVFLATGWSSSSDMCRIELEWAHERGRRIVVVDRDGSDPPAHGPLGFLAHIQVLRWPGSAASPPGLGQAVAREPERLRDLATLDREALEWVAAGRERARLLRGAPLAAAVRLVATASGRPPEAGESVTKTSVEFVDAGRAYRVVRRRLWTALTALGVVAALIAVILVVVNRNAATTAEEGRLAGAWRREAVDLLGTDPAAALRLQIDAYALAPTPEARSTLARDVLGEQLRRTLADRPESIRSLAYSADGAALITGSSDSRLRVYGDRDTAARATERPGRTLDGVASAGGFAAVGADGRILVGRVTPTGVQSEVSTEVEQYSVAPGALSADGARLVAGALTDAAVLYRVLPSGALEFDAPLPRQSGTVTSATLAPSGQLTAVAEEDGVVVWDVGEPGVARVLRRLPLPSPAQPALAFSPDGLLLAIGTAGGVTVVDPRNDTPPVRTLSRPSPVEAVAFSPSGDGRLAMIDVTGATVYGAGPNPEAEFRRQGVRPFSLAYRPDGRAIAVGGVDGSVSEWTLTPPGLPRLLARGTAPEIQDVLPVPDDGLTVVAAGDRPATGVPVSVGAAARELTGPTVPAPAVVTIAGDRAALGSLDGRVEVVDLSQPSPRSLGAAALDAAGPVGTLEFAPDGSRVAVGGGEGPGMVRRVPDLAPAGRLDVVDVGFARVARFRPDGRRIAVGGNDGNVALYDVLPDGVARVGQVLGEGPVEDRERISDLAWSPDGNTLAIASEDGVRLVPVADPARPGAPLALPGLGPTSSLAWPSGRPLLLTWSNSALGAWDTGDDGVVRPLGTWPIGSLDDFVVRADPTGRWLSTATIDSWATWSLAGLLDVAADPFPAACLVAAVVPTTPERATRLQEAGATSPC